MLSKIAEEKRENLKKVKKKAKKLNENKSSSLKSQIARESLLIGVKARKAKGELLIRFNTALNLLTQAQVLATGGNEVEAKKLLVLARSFKSGSDSKDERREKRPKSGKSINEKGKKSTTR